MCEPPGSCTGKADGIECRLGDETGRCASSQCEAIPPTCGDGEVDDREACDAAATSCYELAFAYGVEAPCRSCLHDTSGCRQLGWVPLAGAPPGGMIAGGLWVRDHVAWAATDRGLYRLEGAQWTVVESGTWRWVGAAADGTVYAMHMDNTKGTVVRLGDTRSEHPLPTGAGEPLAMVVRADGEVIVTGSDGAHHLTATGWRSRLFGGTAFNLHDAGTAVFATGTLGVRGLWRYDGGDWTLIPNTADVFAISGTEDALYLTVSGGGLRKLTPSGATTLSPLLGGRFASFGDGHVLLDGDNLATFIDAADRLGTMQVPSAIAASAWDPIAQRLWVATTDGVYVHAGVEVERAGEVGDAIGLGVADMMMVDGALALALDYGSSAALWTLAPGGLDPFFIGSGYAPIGNGGAVDAVWFQDRDRYYVIRGGEVWSYDRQRGAAPVEQALAARAIASNGDRVMAVGAGAWQLGTGMMWSAIARPSDALELRALAPLGAGFIAAGDGGGLYAIVDGQWTRWATGTSATLSAVHVVGDRVFAVGSGGTILACRAGACDAAITGVSSDLTDIDGTLDDLIAVGGGATLRFDGERWHRLALDIAATHVTFGDGVVWLDDQSDRALYRLLRQVP